MSDPRLVERVLKLLALASGTSFAAEAASARAKAEELISKHNISLPKTLDRGAYAWVNYSPFFKRMQWELHLARAATRLTGCRVFFYSKDQELLEKPFILVGTVADLEACQYLLAILHDQRMKAWMAAKASGASDRFHSFCFSFASAVLARAEAQAGPEDERRAIEARSWYEREVSKLGTANLSMMGGRGRSDAGREAGEGASLHRGTMGGEAPKRLR